MTIRFDGRVAIVTGAGNGLGRAHALGLASRGAKVVVNDFGGARDGTGGSLTPAEAVVEEIRKAGGVAMADGADVSNFEQVKAMVATRHQGMGQRRSALRQCRHPARQVVRQDGSRRFRQGARRASRPARFYCCKAVWDGMRERNYGRIVAHHLVVGPVRQFRPGQLRRGEIRHGRPDERAGRGGPQEQHPRQHDLADRGDAHDRGIAAAAGAGADEAGGDHAGGGIICSARTRRPAPSWARAPARSR